jgi:uncharacterized membrane protein YphA (DoxX/SURF4 family)
MVNPIHLFFASKAGGAALVLRLTISAFLLYDAVIMTTALVAPQSASLAPLAWDWLLPKTGWGSLLFRWAAGLGLLIGFFTRLIALWLVLFMGIAWARMLATDPSGAREVILAASLSLALVFAGGGAFSFDRKISDYLLPSLY